MRMLREMIELFELSTDLSTTPIDVEDYEESAVLFKMIFATCAALNMPSVGARYLHSALKETRQSSWGTLPV